MLDSLASLTTLLSLDLNTNNIHSLNRIDHSYSVDYEDVLPMLSNLTNLDISGNPIVIDEISSLSLATNLRTLCIT